MNHLANRPYILVMTCLAIVISGCSVHSTHETVPSAKRGVIDLEDWNFGKRGIARLAGEWEFHPGVFLSANGTDTLNAGTDFIEVPGRWNTYTVAGRKFGSDGFGSYKLRVLLNGMQNDLTLQLPEIYSAYELFIDGKKIASMGTISTHPGNEIPDIAQAQYPVSGAGPVLDIVIRISNFSDVKGGMWHMPPELGKTGTIHERKELFLLLQVFVFGCLIITAFSHLFLFLLRKEDMASLYFCFFCLASCIHMFVSGYTVLFNYIFDIEWAAISRIGFLSYFLTVPLFNLYVFHGFRNEYAKVALLPVIVTGVFFCLISLLAPLRFLSGIFDIYTVMLVLDTVYILFIIVRALVSRREGATVFLAGFLILVAIVINEILSDGQIFDTFVTTPVGFIVFSTTHSFFIASKFARSFRTIQDYAEEISSYSRNLEMKVAERTKQLEEAIEQKTRMFIHIAHESKTPLTLINNYLFKFMKTHDRSEDLEIVRRNINTLATDMIDFLDLEKISNEKTLYDHEKAIDLSAVLRNKVLLFHEAARNKLIDFECEIGENIHTKMDPSAFDRFTNNLLDNAIKYTEPGGSVHVSLSRDREDVIITVEDTGIGMEQHQLDNIFKPFYQAKENSSGIGIGLTIAAGIIDEAGGKISVTSTPGVGTRFIVVLDAYEPSADDTIHTFDGFSTLRDPSRRIDLRDSRYREGLPNVFIVEDNAEMSAYLAESLGEKFNVACAVDGRDAIQKIGTIRRPSVIISDIMMRGMDGHELFDELSGNDRYADIPFIFLTARSSIDEKRASLARGAIDFISKPFDVGELCAKIDSLVRNTRAIRKSSAKRTTRKILSEVRKSTVTDSMLHFERNCRRYGISKREKEIIELVFKGKLNKEICDELHIMYNTIRNHIANIYKKCGVNTKIELMNKLKASTE